MGFNGLVVTDALNMKGITKYFSTSEVAVMCVEAGVDLILMPLDEEKTVDAIEAAVLNGKVTKERIEKSAEKILKTKQWLGLYENKYVAEADVWKTINTSEAGLLAQQIADESITLVKDNNNIFPLKTDTKTAVIVVNEDSQDNTAYLNSTLPSYFNNYDYLNSGEVDISSMGYYNSIVITISQKSATARVKSR